jgi:hypothetical protein
MDDLENAFALTFGKSSSSEVLDSSSSDSSQVFSFNPFFALWPPYGTTLKGGLPTATLTAKRSSVIRLVHQGRGMDRVYSADVAGGRLGKRALLGVVESQPNLPVGYRAGFSSMSAK